MKEIEPVPGVSPEEARHLTPGRRMYLRRKAAGICVHCAKNNRCSESKALCETCLVNARERQASISGRRDRYYQAASYAIKSPIPVVVPPATKRTSKSARKNRRKQKRPIVAYD